jgi:hypothetical protein
MNRQCPDCTAAAPDLQHDTTCLVGRAIETTAFDDRAWFAAHPGQRQRLRVVEGPERTYLQLAGCSVASTAFVIVTLLAPGIRNRSYRGVFTAGQPGSAPGESFIQRPA